MDAIISMCNFTVEEYSPALDSVAVGVKVKLSSAAAPRARPAAEVLGVGLVLGLVGLAGAFL